MNARILIGIFVTAVMATILFHGQAAESATPRSKMKPNARTEAPPLQAASIATIKTWLDNSSWPWRKEEIRVDDQRKLVCIDLRPYSGQPGHHVFIYQVLNDNVAMLFSAVIYKPPYPEKHLTFTHALKADSLTIACGDTQCLVVALETLWCN